MNNGVIISAMGTLLFLLFALVFTLLKDKATDFISGFNFISKEERELYDKTKMWKDHRKFFLVCAAIWESGAILSYFFTQYMAIISFVVWLIVLFRNIHLDDEKAFGKYKLK